MTRSTPGQLEMDVAVSTKTMGIVRTIVTAHLRLWGLGSLVDRAVVAVSALLDNVVKHVPPPAAGQAPVAQLILTRIPGNGLFVSVHDAEETFPRPGVATVWDQRGRGLRLIEECADEYGVSPSTGGGKDVWLTLFNPDRPPSPRSLGEHP